MPIDITNPTVHGYYAALVTHQAYYYLYGLYTDYPRNNAWYIRREYDARIRERLRELQPLLWQFTPYRKSPALRLFTERAARGRFPPELTHEGYRELRALIERLGPPRGWRPPGSAVRRRARAKEASGSRPEAGRPSGAGRQEPAPARKPPFPRSPIDYEQDV